MYILEKGKFMLPKYTDCFGEILGVLGVDVIGLLDFDGGGYVCNYVSVNDYGKGEFYNGSNNMKT